MLFLPRHWHNPKCLPEITKYLLTFNYKSDYKHKTEIGGGSIYLLASENIQISIKTKVIVVQGYSTGLQGANAISRLIPRKVHDLVTLIEQTEQYFENVALLYGYYKYSLKNKSNITSTVSVTDLIQSENRIFWIALPPLSDR